jgi:ATP synthase I subunit
VLSTRQTQKRYCSRAIIIAIFFWLGCYLIGEVTVGKGVVLGTLFSILNFIIMGETLPMQIVTEKRGAFFRSLGAICFRYGLLAVPLYIGIKNPKFNLFAVIAGIFSIQLLILVDHIKQYTQKPKSPDIG